MESNTKQKKKVNSIIISGFLWDFLRESFQCGFSHQYPFWAIVGGTHSDIVTLYLKHFKGFFR